MQYFNKLILILPFFILTNKALAQQKQADTTYKLVAADTGPAVSYGARLSIADRHRAGAGIEHDKVVAESVHLAEFPGGQPVHGRVIW